MSRAEDLEPIKIAGVAPPPVGVNLHPEEDDGVWTKVSVCLLASPFVSFFPHHSLRYSKEVVHIVWSGALVPSINHAALHVAMVVVQRCMGTTPARTI